MLERPGAFDAIVVGAGAAGGLAAERLTQGGLKVLLLEAGFPRPFLHAPARRLFTAAVSRIANPDFLPFMPPELLFHGRRALRLMGRIRQRVQVKCYAWERRPDAFVDDIECPYTTPAGRPFFWIRVRGLQGRVGIPGHGRLYFRLGCDDFAPSGEAESPAWPFSHEEIDPWYADVEKRLGISGALDGLPWLPDSMITHPLVPTATETAFIDLVKTRWPGFRPVLGRFAPPADTLEGAAATGRLTLRQGAIVRSVEVRNQRVTGVRWFDQASRGERKAVAPLVFLCASSLESTRILMLSEDSASGRAIGAQSNALGHHLMDHVVLVAEGTGAALLGQPPVKLDGRCVYLPRFDAREEGTPRLGRGFGVQVYQASMARGRSHFMAVSFSEMLPRHGNCVTLNRQRLDHWGIPTLHIDCTHGEHELKRAADQTEALRALADAAKVSLQRLDRTPSPPGHAIHECGTARMGLDPAASVLDPDNQCWDAAGLYLTDGASFPSQGSQNPTLTIMALTARACAHALREEP